MGKSTTAVVSVTPATVDFRGHQLTVITGPAGEHLVAMKPICEAIGLDWDGQRQRINRHPVLSTCAVVMTAQMAGDDQRREVACLPLDYLNGWLFGVDASRVRPEIRDTLIQYQRECFCVLAAYWQQGEAVNPRKTRKPKALPNGLNLEQQDAIKGMVHARVEALPVDKRKGAVIRCWSALKSKFGCGYKEIAPEQFTEAVSLVARIELEGEWLGKPGSFADIIGRALSPIERWMVCIDFHGNEQYRPIPPDACVMTHHELLRAMVTPSDMPVSTEELFEFAMAAMSNLKARSTGRSLAV